MSANINYVKSLVMDSSKFKDEGITNKMIRALSGIALEMQTFNACTDTLHRSSEKPEMYEKLRICKSNLRLKRKQIKLLKQNLRNACIVAKTVISAKEKEAESMHNCLRSAHSDCIELYQKNITTSETMQDLALENNALLEKINNLEEFIELGYDQLQKMRDKRPVNSAPIIKLKEIMISCGQYYADLSNEYDTRLQLEQRNRFLNNKIKILVNNLEGLAEEIKNLRYQNSKLQKENFTLKNRFIDSIKSKSTGTIGYPFTCGNKVKITHLVNDIMAGDFRRENMDIFNLTSHLTLVQKLLNSQDHMLMDLKKLSETLSTYPKEGEI